MMCGAPYIVMFMAPQRDDVVRCGNYIFVCVIVEIFLYALRPIVQAEACVVDGLFLLWRTKILLLSCH